MLTPHVADKTLYTFRENAATYLDDASAQERVLRVPRSELVLLSFDGI